VYLRREMPPDDMGCNTIRNRGPTVLKSHTRRDMECCKNPRDGSPPHGGRSQKSPRGPTKGSNSEREILADATGWHSGPPTAGNKTGVFCILEYKRMSDVCDRYLIRAKSKSTAENQYASLRSVISDAITHSFTVTSLSYPPTICGCRWMNRVVYLNTLAHRRLRY
jgi:hypothetical protein